MITWKHSFKRLNEEYEMAQKKKQALDNLVNSGRISQSTYDLVNMEISEALSEIEKQQEVLLEKMKSKMMELEERIKTLEMLLANSEIQHVTGEIDEENYQKEISLLSMGLDIARQELDVARDAVNHLSINMQMPPAETVVQPEVKSETVKTVTVSKTEIQIVEETAVKASEPDSPQTLQEQQQEALQGAEQPQPKEAVAEGGEKQEA